MKFAFAAVSSWRTLTVEPFGTPNAAPLLPTLNDLLHVPPADWLKPKPAAVGS